MNLQLDVNLAEHTLNATLITKVNIAGGMNGWNSDDPNYQMEWNGSENCYVIENTSVSDSDWGWKFTFNGGWDINLGGQLSDLVEDGENLLATGTKVKLYPCRINSTNIYAVVE